jgi:hypothetical protein
MTDEVVCRDGAIRGWVGVNNINCHGLGPVFRFQTYVYTRMCLPAMHARTGGLHRVCHVVHTHITLVLFITDGGQARMRIYCAFAF